MRDTSKSRKEPLPLLVPPAKNTAMLSEKFVEWAHALLEQSGSIPESECDEWLEASDEFLWKKSA